MISERPLSWFARPVFRWSVVILATVVAGVLIFEALGISIFKRIGMPHEFCYVQDPRLVWLHVSSDFFTGVAYVSISVTLGYLVYKASKGIPFHWVFLAFGLFIISCGITHFMEIWVIWEPVYWLSAFIKIITAIASVATAIALFPLVPKVFALIEAARKSEHRKREIEQLNQELERFNYSVAHDLRSPLRRILSFGELLREELTPTLSATSADYLGRMQTSVNRMDALISDLLKYATVGRQELVLKPVPLDEVVRAATELLDEEIRARNAEIVTAPPLPSVLGDATLLQVVFQNLIGNAIKFVAPGTRPRVEILARRSGECIRIIIADNGIGIPAEARPRIFRMFERVHSGIPGTGIGLPIVHRAIERLGGKIGLNETPANSGTQFYIELPSA